MFSTAAHTSARQGRRTWHMPCGWLRRSVLLSRRTSTRLYWRRDLRLLQLIPRRPVFCNRAHLRAHAIGAPCTCPCQTHSPCFPQRADVPVPIQATRLAFASVATPPLGFPQSRSPPRTCNRRAMHLPLLNTLSRLTTSPRQSFPSASGASLSVRSPASPTSPRPARRAAAPSGTGGTGAA